jgi:hypothetical protein
LSINELTGCCIEKIVEAFLAQGLGEVSQSFLSFPCHSGLDPESSVSELDSRLRGMTSWELM